MKIIDAHIHFAQAEHFEFKAQAAGHENNSEHLLNIFRENNIVAAIAMGTYTPEPMLLQDALSYPRLINLSGEPTADMQALPTEIFYACGLNNDNLRPENLAASLQVYERHFRNCNCVGLKLYPGYNSFYLTDSLYHEFYALARDYDLPVVIHTGDTARANGCLKYSHPLVVDELAVLFPEVRFVIAHYGNPWIVDATAVAKKNPNVYIELSGLAEGVFDIEWFFENYSGYVQHLRTWLQYLSSYEKVLYGSDWPLVNIPLYINMMTRLLPEKYHEQFFYDNARNVFPKLRII